MLFRGLIEKYPEAALVVMTPIHRDNEDERNAATGLFLSEYVTLLRSAAEKYSIPILDLYAQGGIVPAVPASKERFCPDGLHPNDEGHRLIAQQALCVFTDGLSKDQAQEIGIDFILKNRMVLREKKIKGGMKDMSEKKLPRVTPEEVGVESRGNRKNA